MDHCVVVGKSWLLASSSSSSNSIERKRKREKIKIPARMRSSSDSCLRMKKKRFSLVVEAVCYLGLAIRLDHPFFV
jgi:hypothetical protein